MFDLDQIRAAHSAGRVRARAYAGVVRFPRGEIMRSEDERYERPGLVWIAAAMGAWGFLIGIGWLVFA